MTGYHKANGLDNSNLLAVRLCGAGAPRTPDPKDLLFRETPDVVPIQDVPEFSPPCSR